MNQWSYRRRKILGATVVGMGTLAGCTGNLEDRFGEADNSEGDNESDEGDNESDEGDADDEQINGDNWGESIPTYPHPETESEPLNPIPDPEVDNPVLTADDVEDINARSVADPFLFIDNNGNWHMFFEAVESDRGRIAHAISPDEGVSWEYDQVLLSFEHHVSYPYVFKWKGEHYLIHQALPPDQPITLYKSNAFPGEWYRAAELYDPSDYDHGITDHVLFRWDDYWWSLGGYNDEYTFAYYSETLESSNWTPHEGNPIVEGRPEASRPGGRPIVRNEDIIMFYQDLEGMYGANVRAFRIGELTPSTYEDAEFAASPIIRGTNEVDEDDEPTWNSQRMHHYDPWYLGEGEGWRTVVDGNDGGDNLNWSIGIYRVPE